MAGKRKDVLKCSKCGSDKLKIVRIPPYDAWLVCFNCGYIDGEV
jgi:uncharacterized Zn finger protein